MRSEGNWGFSWYSSGFTTDSVFRDHSSGVQGIQESNQGRKGKHFNCSTPVSCSNFVNAHTAPQRASFPRLLHPTSLSGLYLVYFTTKSSSLPFRALFPAITFQKVSMQLSHRMFRLPVSEAGKIVKDVLASLPLNPRKHVC